MITVVLCAPPPPPRLAVHARETEAGARRLTSSSPPFSQFTLYPSLKPICVRAAVASVVRSKRGANCDTRVASSLNTFTTASDAFAEGRRRNFSPDAGGETSANLTKYRYLRQTARGCGATDEPVAGAMSDLYFQFAARTNTSAPVARRWFVEVTNDKRRRAAAAASVRFQDLQS